MRPGAWEASLKRALRFVLRELEVYPPPAPEPVAAPASPAPEPVAAPTPAPTAPDDADDELVSDDAPRALTFETVQELLDDLVRPALQADGGDISLLKVEENDVYVKLVGACTSCPSSVMTLRMGVERLLQDEFPEMGELVQVDAGVF